MLRVSRIPIVLGLALIAACGSTESGGSNQGSPSSGSASTGSNTSSTQGQHTGITVVTGTSTLPDGGVITTSTTVTTTSAASNTASGSASGSASASSTGEVGSGGVNPWIHFDPATIVARSNIVLLHPNSTATQFMPVGNGSLGAAVWAANGFTAQLNRAADTFPDRKSPGWLTIPGLQKMTGASDFKGALDLYDGILEESGGGMTARIYVRADADELVVDVTGVDPSSSQTATVSLWSGRSPQAQASGAIATLSETFADKSAEGNSGKTFGSLAAVTAGGMNVKATSSGSSATVTFQPNSDGSFRVVCGSPAFNGSSPAATVASGLLGSDATAADLESTTSAWWNGYWGRVGLMKVTSSDGSGEYMENLRVVYLYVSAAQNRASLPGTQAGISDVFSFTKDSQPWYPAGYWFWNLRMQVAANMSSGAFDMNAPIFNLYASNVSNMEAWTKSDMGNRSGACVPETMRFNGNGAYAYAGDESCDQNITPSYNSLTISSGSEVGLWIWQQYLMTGDQAFLQTNYPVMSQAATFLLAYAKAGSDGLLHTTANAHETQWNVTDPMTDISAMRALFPAVISAAQVLGTDASLVTQLQAAIPKLPDFPRTNTARNQVLRASSDSSGDIFAYSTQPTAATHNVENLDLEPLWPYNLISPGTSEFTVATRTYSSRAFHDNQDWSFDAVQAARLGLASEVPARLGAVIKSYQVFPSGMASWDPNTLTVPYVEQVGVLTTALNEALVQDYDGTVRIAPAWPTSWSASGTVFIQGSSRVDVQYQTGGGLAFAVLVAGSTGMFNVANPWSGTQVVVIDDGGQQVVAPTSGATLAVSAQQGHSYLIKKSSDAVPTMVDVTGTAATAVRTLGSRTIGVP